MKAILEFNLPEDKSDHYFAIHGADYWLAFQDLDNWLRGKLKYEEMSEEESKALENCRATLHDCLDNRNVTLNDVY